MGAVNEVVDHADLETVALDWAAAINGKSPQAIRMLKFAFNLIDDGLVGQQLFAGEATRLAYMTDEAVEGRDAFLEKRDPDWSHVPPLLLGITRLRRRGGRRGWILTRLSTVVMVRVATMNSSDVTIPISGRVERAEGGRGGSRAAPR